jgi:hypothetical protein
MSLCNARPENEACQNPHAGLYDRAGRGPYCVKCLDRAAKAYMEGLADPTPRGVVTMPPYALGDPGRGAYFDGMDARWKPKETAKAT